MRVHSSSLVCVLALLSCLCRPVPRRRRPRPRGALQADLACAAGRARSIASPASLDGVVGYVVTDLTTNERVAARLEREPFPTASAIKLSVLYEMLKQAEAGTLTLDTPAPVNRRSSSGAAASSST